MSSRGPSKGKSKTKSSRAMERLKDHNTSLPRPSQSSRAGSSGAKACHSRLSHHSITTCTTGSRRRFSDDSSPERRLSRTRSLDDYRRHYGNRGIASKPRVPVSRKRDRSRSRDLQDPQEGEIEKLGLGWKAERAIMVLSVTKIDQLMKRTLVTLTLCC